MRGVKRRAREREIRRRQTRGWYGAGLHAYIGYTTLEHGVPRSARHTIESSHSLHSVTVAEPGGFARNTNAKTI
jgi:hypothetical protein